MNVEWIYLAAFGAFFAAVTGFLAWAFFGFGAFGLALIGLSDFCLGDTLTFGFVAFLAFGLDGFGFLAATFLTGLFFFSALIADNLNEPLAPLPLV